MVNEIFDYSFQVVSEVVNDFAVIVLLSSKESLIIQLRNIGS